MITVRIVQAPGVLVGVGWIAAGETIELPDDRARQLIHDGAAVLSRSDIVPIHLRDEYAVAEPPREVAAKRTRAPKPSRPA